MRQCITRPMKAPNDAREIQQQYYEYPCMASPKIDGIRCITEEVGVVTSSFKPQPNAYVVECLRSLPFGLDGELVDKSFRDTLSSVRCEWGRPDFLFCIFDYVKDSLTTPAWERYNDLVGLDLPDYCLVLPQTIIYNDQQLHDLECEWLGHSTYAGLPLDGVMLRALDGRYKCNRATLNERLLLKDKPYEDSEAVVLAIFEQEENTNEARTNELGLTSRSHHQSGKVGKQTLGGFQVRDIKTGVEFRLGNGDGWTTEFRQEVYNNPDKYIGRVLTYKHLPVGGYDAPRNATAKGWREAWDMTIE